MSVRQHPTSEHQSREQGMSPQESSLEFVCPRCGDTINETIEEVPSYDVLADRESDAQGYVAENIVYRDNVPEQLMDAFESLVVVASESMQRQTYAEVLRTLSGIFPDLPPSLQERAADVVLRSLSALGEHVLVRDIDEALSSIAAVLSRSGRTKSADAIRSAHAELAFGIGRLNARSVRVRNHQGGG